MAAGQPLRGFVGQSMAGRKKRPNFSAAGTGPVYTFPHQASGSYTFTTPASGRWKFVGWGPGSTGSGGVRGGASGGYFEVTRALAKGQAVTIAVVNSADTVITMPDGTVATAGAASSSGAVAGAASGGDVNLAGTVGVASGNGSAGLGTGGGPGGTTASAVIGGAGAPANLPFRGGSGGGQTMLVGPGGGAADSGQGGQGLALAVFIPT